MRRIIPVTVLVLAFAVLAFFLVQNRSAPEIVLSNAQAVMLDPASGQVAVYLTLDNPGGADVLVEAASPAAESVRIEGSEGTQNGLAIPAGSSPSLSADGAYLVLEGVDAQEGALLPIALTFEHAPVGRSQVRLSGSEDVSADPHAMHRATMGQDHQDTDLPVPSLSLSVEQSDEGWRVEADVDGFRFVEPIDPPVDVPGEGHGHLYLNGLKLQRMYTPSATIGALPKGRHVVRVSLNGHDHSPVMAEGVPLAETQVILVE